MAKSQLIKDIVSKKISLEEGLQRLLIITYTLENKILGAWIESELNGYPSIEKLPDYRKNIAYKILYTGINGTFKVTNVPLPTNYLTDELNEILKETCILDGIKSIEETVQSDSKVGRDLTDMASFIYEKVGVTCVSITQEYSTSSLQKIISSVQSKLIYILLELESEFGNLDSLDIDTERVASNEIENINRRIENRIYYDGRSEEI